MAPGNIHTSPENSNSPTHLWFVSFCLFYSIVAAETPHPTPLEFPIISLGWVWTLSGTIHCNFRYRYAFTVPGESDFKC